MQFEIASPTRNALTEWMKYAEFLSDDYLVKSRFKNYLTFQRDNMPEWLNPGLLK